MTRSRTWEAFPEDLEATAPRVGPFPHRPFLEALWRHRAGPAAELHIETSPTGACALVESDGYVSFAGQTNLTDYHAPLGPDGPLAVVAGLERFPGTTFRLDSLPAEAATPIVEALEAAGVSATTSDHEIAAVLSLPTNYEDWLAALGKKQRHEVRRKRRRFEAEFGAIEIERHTGDAIDAFCQMHRLSAGDKGEFMTAPMEAYFAELLESAGASIHLLLCEGVARAAAFGFETPDGYYYYNSAYDPAAAMASPGVVLFSAMIETEIERGAVVFDFLKGDEQYKFRHGAEPRQLYVVEGRTT